LLQYGLSCCPPVVQRGGKGVGTGMYAIRVEYMHVLMAISIRQDWNWNWRQVYALEEKCLD